MSDIFEAFQELKGLDEASFSFDKPGVLELKKFLDDSSDTVEDTVKVVDPNAESKEDLKKDYDGEVILKCSTCGGLLTKEPKEVVIDSETELSNVEEECPYCGNVGGYEIVGEINVPATFEDALDDSFKYVDEPHLKPEDKVKEGYTTLSDTEVKCFSDYNAAKKYAESHGLKEAEYGDVHGMPYAYCYWNKTGDRNDDEEVIAYYAFEKGKARPLTDTEKKFVERNMEVTFDDEIKEEASKNNLRESIDDFYSADNGRVTAECYTKSTRTYNYEYVDLIVAGKKATGKYRWMNRPWYRFKFSSAFIQAADALGYKNEANRAVDDSHDIEEAVKKFAEYIKEDDKSVKGRKHLDNLPEDFDVSSSVIKKFLEDSVKGLVSGDATNYRYKLDDRFAIFVGWSEGYDEKDEEVIHDKEDPSFGVTAGVKVWTSDDMWTDFDYLNYPYYDNGDVLDVHYSISEDENYTWLANELLDEYNNVKDLNVDRDGKVIEESANTKGIKESFERGSVIEFPSGDYVYVTVEDGKLVAGGATNTGIIHEYELDIEGEEPTDSELQELYELIIKEHPEYEDEITESCKKGKKQNRKMKISEGVSSKAYDVADLILDMIPNETKVVSWEDFDKYFESACNKVKVTKVELDDPDFETDVRAILSQSGWETIFEGEKEGGIKKTFDESCNKSKKQNRKIGKLDEGVKIISDLSDYEPWSGAVDTWSTIQDAGMVDALDDYLEEVYPEGLTMTELNDLLWFDGDSVLEDLGIMSESKIKEKIEEVVEDLKSKYGESFDSQEEFEDRIIDDISDKLNGKDAEVEFGVTTFGVIVDDVEVSFDLEDFDISDSKEESLKEAREKETEVEDLFDNVMDTLQGLRYEKSKDGKVSRRRTRGLVDFESQLFLTDDDNVGVYAKSDEESDKIIKTVMDKFKDEGVTYEKSENKYSKRFPIKIKFIIPKDKIIHDLDKKLIKNESVNESVENVVVQTDTDKVTVTPTGNGDVSVETQSTVEKEEQSDEATIQPVSAETREEIESNDDDSATDEEQTEDDSSEIEEFDETEFDELGESYLQSVYDNVKSFKTSNGYINRDKIKLEGIIEFNSGKRAKTSFVFEKYTKTSRGKYKLIGENLQITGRKNAFILTGSVKNHKLFMESLTYNYTAKDAKSGKSLRVYGTKKVK